MERAKEDIIVAFDVGLKTGVAVIELGLPNKIFTSTVDVEHLMKYTLWADNVIAANIWVIENFMLYAWEAKNQKFQKMDAARVIGVLMHRAFELSIDIVFQNAGNVKPVFPDNIMESFGFADIKNHERDALRHALYYIKKNRKEDLRWVIEKYTIQRESQ